MTARRLLATGAAALLIVGLSACSDDTPPESGSSSTSASSSASDEGASTPTDSSDQVFEAWSEQEVLGSSAGPVSMAYGDGTVTFEVTGLTVTDSATVLSYQLSSDEEVLFALRGRDWNEQPAIRVPGSDVRMQTVTASLPALGSDDQEGVVCGCTAMRDALTTAQPQEVVYPPLDDDVTEVDVILHDLDPVTVPVTTARDDQ